MTIVNLLTGSFVFAFGIVIGRLIVTFLKGGVSLQKDGLLVVSSFAIGFSILTYSIVLMIQSRSFINIHALGMGCIAHLFFYIFPSFIKKKRKN